MERHLEGMKVAILVADGFEQSELVEPKKSLDNAGAETRIISPKGDKVQGWRHFEKGDAFPVDLPVDQADADEYDALLLPGGVANPDQLRMNPDAVEFVKRFVRTGKPIAAICHGPWTLIDAGGVRGRRMTSWPSLRSDLKNAGAKWVDREVVSHHGLVTSRKPDDIPAFNEKMIEEFAKGRRRAGRIRRQSTAAAQA